MNIKDQIKKHNGIAEIYRQVSRIYRNIYTAISPKYASQKRYHILCGGKCNLKQPKTFNENLMALKLGAYNKNSLVTQCVDKYCVREYVERCGYKYILNELYAVCDRAEDIPWDTLPERFVIKCNHGCDYNLIFSDNKNIDKEKAEIQLNKWLNEKYWLKAAETNYRYIKPKIIVEKYLETKAGKFPIDYRFYSSYGTVKTCLLMHYTDNYEQHDSYHIYVDKNYKPCNIYHSLEEAEFLPEKPSNFDEMWKCAEALSKPFPFVRVDLYSCDGNTVFGELTFTPCGCTGKYNVDPKLDEMFKDIYTGSVRDIV